VRAITASRAEHIPIGELSLLSGVNIETIRYYERIKMLPPPRRTASGRRVYGATDLRILAFIRRSRELGFSLNAIRALLRLGAPGMASCSEVKVIATHHLEDIRAKLSDLKKAGAAPGKDGCPMLGQEGAKLPCFGHSRYSAGKTVSFAFVIVDARKSFGPSTIASKRT
jgi:MerR family transcriptional regulator, mercuric resistance operon regulatory protein